MIGDIDLDKVEELAAQGLTYEQIAISLGINTSTLYRHRQRLPELHDAIKRGRDRGIATVANKLFEAAMSGNITAIIFYLKTQAGWKEGQIIEQRIVDERDVARTMTTEELLKVAGLPGKTLDDFVHHPHHVDA